MLMELLFGSYRQRVWSLLLLHPDSSYYVDKFWGVGVKFKCLPISLQGPWLENRFGCASTVNPKKRLKMAIDAVHPGIPGK